MKKTLISYPSTTAELCEKDEEKGYIDGMNWKKNKGSIRACRSSAYKKGLDKAVKECRENGTERVK